MSDTLATYSFLPWLRQGLANNITQTETSPGVTVRPKIPVELGLTGKSPSGAAITQSIPKDVEMYGPGDIIGIDSRIMIKSEPRNWITNFEPNYLPYVDFYEEDFPWRYTPLAPVGERLRPWLTLVVLKESEFEELATGQTKPLPSFKLKEAGTATIFPKPSELWAWAHVHVNTDLSNNAGPANVNSNPVAINTSLSTIINKNPDTAYARLLSSRKLEENVGYHAFLIPTFESGRLAGLGLDLSTLSVGNTCAWDNAATNEFPYYHRWYFRTGNVGDFEYLVNMLEPKPADKTVGVRDMDVTRHMKEYNLTAIDNTTNPGLNGLLKLGGALRVPFDSLKDSDKTEVKAYDEWDEHPYPHPFTVDMSKLINLADDYENSAHSIVQINKGAGILSENSTDGDPDPVITSPLYGRWHALQKRLLKSATGSDLPQNKNWVHELNLDPRFRVAAGLGTKVMQKGQEEYMQAAWQQVGKVIEANQKIRMAQVASMVSTSFYELHLKQLPQNKVLSFAAPVSKRVMYQNFTVKNQISNSVIAPALTSARFRNLMAPRSTAIKKLSIAGNGLNEKATAFNLIERINKGELIATPPKKDPEGGIKLSDLEKQLPDPNANPGLLGGLASKSKWLKYVPLIILAILVLVILFFFLTVTGLVFLAVSAIVLLVAYVVLDRWSKATTITSPTEEKSLQEQQVPEAVDDYPKSPDFTITAPGSNFNPSTGETDSEESENFKIALKDAFTVVSLQFPEPIRKPLDLQAFENNIVTSLDPKITIPKWTYSGIVLPGHIEVNLKETFAPVMAYPEIDAPMYKPLAAISSELFLPNLNKIEPNSITLLENNQKFIEAYMVGVNHEMSRELLWREYPTDQRGTYFRQFWDVSSVLSVQPEPPGLKESLRDIPPIHTWSKLNGSKLFPSDPDSVNVNELGAHNQRALSSGKTQLVLVIRGELLKKYPTAVVYAQKADWGEKNGVKDVNEERVLVELTAAEQSNPPGSKLKSPLFEAKIEPDIYFFGFDLDDEEARGTLNPTNVHDAPGWFFVLKERPGEPRFGLDVEEAKVGAQKRLINYNNLAWPDVGTADGNCIELNKTIILDPYDYLIDQENVAIPDDVQARWSPDTNSAELAYILYQVPVMVAVHASRMLPK
jgi:hypothetical protein